MNIDTSVNPDILFVRLPPELNVPFRHLARTRYLPLAAITRQAIQEYLERHMADQPVGVSR